jgi:NAD(P)-dependent dehydrogenase (short-subunit alcohol dehydrogenase family)
MGPIMQRFENKVVIVTGGGGGIGGAACRRFAAEGARVAVFDMNLAAAAKVAEDIRHAGGVAEAYCCDITDRATVDAAVAETVAKLGPIDVLVNNAGWDVFKPFTKTEPAQWDKLIAINLTGALHMHHAVLPGMAARKTGRIVNIASDAARVGSSGEAVYARAGWSPFRRPSRASIRATASQSMSCAPARPTPPCSPITRKAPAIRTSSSKRSRARFRSAASASQTICRALFCSSPATTPHSSPARCSASPAA